MSDGSLRVFIVDDHAVVRSGLKMLVETEDDLHVIGEAGSGEEALQAIQELLVDRPKDRPDVVLMDLMMGGIGGIETTQRIKQDWPDMNVLVLTMAEDPAYLREAFRAGASGYVLKDTADVELIDALRVVGEGGRYLHPRLGAELARAEEEADEGPATDRGVSL